MAVFNLIFEVGELQKMVQEQVKPEQTVSQTENQEIMFRCRFCGQSRPLKEMVRINRYYPPQVACFECERQMNRNNESAQ